MTEFVYVYGQGGEVVGLWDGSRYTGGEVVGLWDGSRYTALSEAVLFAGG
jgi:hypothetical protein